MYAHVFICYNVWMHESLCFLIWCNNRKVGGHYCTYAAIDNLTLMNEIM